MGKDKLATSAESETKSVGLIQDSQFRIAADILKIKSIDNRSKSAIKACVHLLDPTDHVRKLSDYRKSCLASLAFESMGMREHRVARPELKTCQWIYNDPGYVQWAENENMLLWIKGKPGSGKSVLMKSLHAHRETSRDKQTTLILQFYFNARGLRKERTILGLYRALMHDLLDQVPICMAEFLPTYMTMQQRRRRKSMYPSASARRSLISPKTTRIDSSSSDDDDYNQVHWDAADLAQLFHSMIERESSRSIEVFIDALDECDEHKVRDFVDRAERSIEHAQSYGTRLKICWSSRYYPHIGLRSTHGIELAIDRHINADIDVYVQKELANFPPSLSGPLRDNLVSHAKGVFLWVVLVIKRLRKALDQGKRESELRSLLSSMPAELEDLFDEILRSQSRTEEDQQEFIRLLQWVFCSKGDDDQLKGNLQQSFLVYISMIHQFHDDDRLKYSGILSHEDYILEKHRINDISCGLIEVAGPDSQKPVDAETGDSIIGGHATPMLRTLGSPSGHTAARVQVIHESVRDFFLTSQRSLYVLDAKSQEAFLTLGHRDLADACFRTLLEFDASLPPPPSSCERFRDEVLWIGAAGCQFPALFHLNKFLVYSHRYGLTHFSVAHALFNNNDPSSSSPIGSTTVRRRVIRSYLRLVYFSKIKDDSQDTIMSNGQFDFVHRPDVYRYYRAFGLTKEDLGDLDHDYHHQQPKVAQDKRRMPVNRGSTPPVLENDSGSTSYIPEDDAIALKRGKREKASARTAAPIIANSFLDPDWLRTSQDIQWDLSTALSAAQNLQ